MAGFRLCLWHEHRHTHIPTDFNSAKNTSTRLVSLPPPSLAGHDFSDMGDLNEIHKYAIAPGGIVCQGGEKRGRRERITKCVKMFLYNNNHGSSERMPSIFATFV